MNQTDDLVLDNGKERIFCGVGEDCWEFRGLQEDPTSPS